MKHTAHELRQALRTFLLNAHAGNIDSAWMVWVCYRDLRFGHAPMALKWLAIAAINGHGRAKTALEEALKVKAAKKWYEQHKTSLTTMALTLFPMTMDQVDAASQHKANRIAKSRRAA